MDAAAADTGPAPLPPAAIERLWLGVNDLPEAMLGKATGGPSFTWAVPDQGFTVEVHAVLGPGALPTASPGFTLHSATLGVSSLGDQQGGWTPTPTGAVWRGMFPVALPVGPLTLVAAMPMGQPGPVDDAVAGLDLQVAVRTPELDPFDTVDHWRVTFTRDQGALQVKAVDDGFSVQTLDKPNGIADFDEAMAALGLQGGDAAWNGKALAFLRNRIVTLLRSYYRLDPATGALLPDSVRIQFHLDGGPPPPDGVPLSHMALGGDAPKIDGKRTLFGRAWIDHRNAKANDDSGLGYGVFPTSMVRTVLGNPLALALLDGVLPAAGGQPFGSLPGDAALLDPALDPATLAPEAKARAGKFQLLTKFLCIGLSAVTAHEIGHSLGLVHPGLPPHGLLGGVSGPWTVTASDPHHIDTPGPNLMQTGSSFNPAEILKELPAFSALEYGYLRGRLLVLPE